MFAVGIKKPSDTKEVPGMTYLEGTLGRDRRLEAKLGPPGSYDRIVDTLGAASYSHDLDRVLRPVRLVVDEDTALGREIGAMAAPSTGSSPRGVAKPETARAAFRARRAAGHY